MGGFAAPGLHSDEAHLDRGRHAECPGDSSGETRAVGEPVENPTNRHQEEADREAEYDGLSPGDRSRPFKSGGGEETGVDEGAEDPESSKDIEHPARMSLWLQIVEERTYRGGMFLPFIALSNV